MQNLDNRHWSSFKVTRLAIGSGTVDDYGMDVNQLAYKIVQQSIGEAPVKKRQPKTAQRGLKRAASLTAEQRREIAVKAARARWVKEGKG
jgi:hypothetical protein